MQICKSCGEIKPFSEFYSLKSGSSKYRAQCKSCLCAAATEWRESLSEDEKTLWRETIDQWKEENPDQVKAHAKRWRDKQS